MAMMNATYTCWLLTVNVAFHKHYLVTVTLVFNNDKFLTCHTYRVYHLTLCKEMILEATVSSIPRTASLII